MVFESTCVIAGGRGEDCSSGDSGMSSASALAAVVEGVPQLSGNGRISVDNDSVDCLATLAIQPTSSLATAGLLFTNVSKWKHLTSLGSISACSHRRLLCISMPGCIGHRIRHAD